MEKIQQSQGIHATVSPQLLIRILRKVKVVNGCWLWTGRTDKHGYAHIKYQGKNVYAHRLIYAMLRETDVLECKDVHHTCRTRGCLHPHHLAAVESTEHRMEHIQEAHRG